MGVTYMVRGGYFFLAGCHLRLPLTGEMSAYRPDVDGILCACPQPDFPDGAGC
jgi:hypothetical protein